MISKRLLHIARRVLAMPMAVVDVSSNEAKAVAKQTMKHFDLKGKPLFLEYIVKQQGTSNKFHLFIVGKKSTGSFVAANAYGRIGYPPRFSQIAVKGNPDDVLAAATKKYKKKKSDGYRSTRVKL